MLVILVVTISIMSPLWSDYPVESAASDLLNHISGIIEAKNAINEGQFPIRVAPNALGGIRYPIFQFYGNFPYTVGGILFLLNIDPYTSYKIVIILSLFIGAFYIYKFGIYSSNNKYASISASIIYLTSPYVLIDIHGRFAFPEIASIGLIPCIFYYFFRVLHSNKLKNIIMLSFFLILLIHTHNIFSFYTIVFLIFMSILYYIVWKKNLFSLACVGTGIVVALLISSWYLVPQMILMPYLQIKSITGNPFEKSFLSTLGVLLAPSLILPKPINFFDNPNLGFQIGWPLLAILFLGTYNILIIDKKLCSANNHSKVGKYSILKTLMICFILSILLAWSPFNLWKYLPYQFYFIQFPYRFLVYVVIFGALSAPISLSRTLNRFGMQHAVVLTLISMTIAGSYLPNHIGLPTNILYNEISHPEMGRGGATEIYRISRDGSNLPTSGEWLLNYYSFYIKVPSSQELLMMKINGSIPEYNTGGIINIEVNDVTIQQVKMETGPFEYLIPIFPSQNQQKSSESNSEFKNNYKYKNAKITFSSNKYFIPSKVDPKSSDSRKLVLAINSLVFFDPNNQEPVVKEKISYDTILFKSNNQPIVELPILYYPGMMDIKVNGNTVDYFNSGEYVAINLPAGENRVQFHFEGTRWANYLSIISLLLYGLIIMNQIKKYIRDSLA